MEGIVEGDYHGLLRRYWHLVLVLFVFYGITSALEGLAVADSLSFLAGLFNSLLVSPLLLAGVIGQIQAFHAGPDEAARRSFFGDMRHFFWRILGVALCYLFCAVGIGVLLNALGASAATSHGPKKPEVITSLFWIPIGALLLFWRVAIVADDGPLFRSFWRCLRAQAIEPAALMVGLGWGTLIGLDRAIAVSCSKPTLLRLAVLRAVVFAFASFWIYSRTLAVYHGVRVEHWKEAVPAAPGALNIQPEVSHPMGVGSLLALFSLVPGINLLALIKGARAIRAGEFSLRSLIACGAGGFSVLICLLALLGSLLPRPGTAAGQSLSSAANGYEVSQITHAVSYVIILLMLFTTHEYAHAFAAWKLGDDTAKNQGRLTLNPLAHLDILGSLVLPGLLVWRHSDVVFGWAKPVPVDVTKFANPRRDHRIVSFAGPGMNLAEAMASFLLLAAIFFVLRLLAPGAFSHKLASPFDSVSLAGVAGAPPLLAAIWFLKQLMYTGVALAFFNLLPIPPLDGGWIFSSLLPERASAFLETVRPYSFVVFFILVFSHVTDYLLALPLLMAWGGLSLVCMALGFS